MKPDRLISKLSNMEMAGRAINIQSTTRRPPETSEARQESGKGAKKVLNTKDEIGESSRK